MQTPTPRWLALATISILTLVPAAAPSASAQVVPAPGCGGAWVQPVAQCTFTPLGQFALLRVEGVAVGVPLADVNVELRDLFGNVVVRCSDIDQGVARCRDTGFAFIFGFQVTCRVTGAIAGTYRCEVAP